MIFRRRLWAFGIIRRGSFGVRVWQTHTVAFTRRSSGAIPPHSVVAVWPTLGRVCYSRAATLNCYTVIPRPCSVTLQDIRPNQLSHDVKEPSPLGDPSLRWPKRLIASLYLKIRRISFFGMHTQISPRRSTCLFTSSWPSRAAKLNLH